MKKESYLNEEMQLTRKAKQEIKQNSPKNAIILAAGFGMRMVPLNTEIPKGLLEIHGEPLIERSIKQLHEAAIYDIYIVVGFQKEKYEYLIDKYEVKLIVNAEYASKNNLYSMRLALEYLSNSYIIPCDIWCARNPYRHNEIYSWYMVSDSMDMDSSVRVNRKSELVSIPRNQIGNAMIGICYLTKKDAEIVKRKIEELCADHRNEEEFWEKALYQGNKMIVSARLISAVEVAEINTYEQLRAIDSDSEQLKTEAINTICAALKVKTSEIKNISVLKKGMTNRSFLFNCKEKKYIMRIPGEGTEQLINRRQEAEVYRVIEDKNICDEIAYINSKNGYKITEFFENARICDPLNFQDVEKCMKRLREFHNMRLSVGHEFDIFKQIEFYESLWEGRESAYTDYQETKEGILSLQPYINAQTKDKVLSHIDAVPDNFLFINTEQGEEIRLIDWEYAGMQDPHIDVAMFSIYALYNRQQIDRTISLYFQEGCSDENRIKIYCYIAACGLLWSNWCEYKRSLGVEFGEYSLAQYRYAKDYYRIVQEEKKKLEGCKNA